MKKTKFLAIILALVLVVGVCLTACGKDKYEITYNADKSLTVTVGDKVDFTQYFTVKKNGNRVAVTEDMLDLSQVDLSKPCTFDVTLSIGGFSKTLTFTVVSKISGGDPEPDDLATVLVKYIDASGWNFADSLTVTNGSQTSQDYYEYMGYNVLNRYTYQAKQHTDYLGYDVSADTYCFYYDNCNGTYTALSEGTKDFEECCSNLCLVDLSQLGNYTFTASGNRYLADNPSEVGNAVIGQFTGYSWLSVEVYVAGGNITKLVGVLDNGYTEQHVFSKHGAVSFTLPTVGSGENPEPDIPVVPTDVMEKQTYNPATFDEQNLQDKMLKVDGAIGLPSTGNINALVIPVQFVGDTITQAQLNNLNAAFNGDSTDTGWESVSSYYQKASYGNLNLTFDIQSVYRAQYNSTYYANYKEKYWQDGQQHTRTGEEIILTEALAYYESRLDLTKYDTNKDGAIDAVYLIYSAPVDYDQADFYWAYVTWYYGENQYDGLDAYYYLFAGFDFMDESTARDSGSGYGTIAGLKINASTFIHETGHLLGLDDYYDYDEDSGSNEGLGGADMMDYTVGDHGVYSKIMLGWLKPTVVNQTTTVTIQSSCSNASAILIPLKFDNSYFCEYLLIDLYSAQGLNALHASAANSYLYGGASYGVRIYHVSSSINSPYNNSYGSFTDHNNTDTKYALIKLVEADGDKKFSSSRGYAAQSDLWQAGAKLSQVFPTYARNDGKKVNFDIVINSVSATSASITITFYN